jgi:hypothetical protein
MILSGAAAGERVETELSHIEEITAGGQRLAYVIRAGFEPDETTFVTDAEEITQAGLVVVAERGEVTRHQHLPVARSIVGTAETLIVRSGGGDMDVFDSDRELVESVELSVGDIIVFLGVGGHGFRARERTVFIEVKQGPFSESDKERFS